MCKTTRAGQRRPSFARERPIAHPPPKKRGAPAPAHRPTRRCVKSVPPHGPHSADRAWRLCPGECTLFSPWCGAATTGCGDDLSVPPDATAPAAAPPPCAAPPPPAAQHNSGCCEADQPYARQPSHAHSPTRALAAAPPPPTARQATVRGGTGAAARGRGGQGAAAAATRPRMQGRRAAGLTATVSQQHRGESPQERGEGGGMSTRPPHVAVRGNGGGRATAKILTRLNLASLSCRAGQAGHSTQPPPPLSSCRYRGEASLSNGKEEAVVSTTSGSGGAASCRRVGDRGGGSDAE